MKFKKKVFICLIITFILITITSCKNNSLKEDVIVLFSNDVHCAIDKNIGYDGLSAYKKDLEKDHKYVVLVDCGDFSQGEYIGAISKGEYIVDIMNEVGYDFAIFGNHEFDYGLNQLNNLVNKSNAKFLNANITYTGKNQNWLEEETIPYEVVNYGGIKVGFIGISTPHSIANSTPTNFMEDGEFVYDFAHNEGASHFYDVIQDNVNKCKEKGADYVIALSHLGVDIGIDSPYTSIEVAQNTTGIDVILDGHSHVEASCWVYENMKGDNVLISSTGTKLTNIGQLVISKDGTISVGYIDNYSKKDDVITNKMNGIIDAFEEQMDAIIAYIGTSDVNLSCNDSDGVRMIRSRELPIGDFVADAYRIIGGADIGMCNGGGIRGDLQKGNITYEQIIAVNPYGNTLCVVKVTGAEILDMLEYFYKTVEINYKENGLAVGEDGSFQQVSGLQFTIDTSIKTSVVKDETDSLVKVGDARRVKDVKVLQNGVYVPIELDKTYTLASHNYMIKNGGSGMMNYLKDHELVIDESIADYQVLIDYLAMLNGDLSQYSKVDNRITIK